MDFVLNIASTFVGALLALLSALWLRRREQDAARRRSVQGCINSIHRRRAYSYIEVEDVDVSESPEIAEDRTRCIASVLATRDDIGRTIDALEMQGPWIEPLEDMQAACLRFLSMVEWNPGRYIYLLTILRRELVDGVNALCELDGDLVLREPGSAQRGVAITSATT